MTPYVTTGAVARVNSPVHIQRESCTQADPGWMARIEMRMSLAVQVRHITQESEKERENEDIEGLLDAREYI